MKIECIKEKLHMAVSKAEKIASKNISLPVLSCLLFETRRNVFFDENLFDNFRLTQIIAEILLKKLEK